MTWLDRIVALFRFKPDGARVYVGQRQAGVIVNPDTATTFSAVNGCVRLISETLASLPWHVYRKAPTGRIAEPGHGVQWLLNMQPNPEQTAYVFRRQLLANYLLWGNGYAEIQQGLDGRAVWLWPMPPDRCSMERSETGALVCRVIAQDGSQHILPRERVYHLADGSFDGISGASRVELARRSIGAGMAQDVFTASYYQNGASIGGVLENKGKTLSVEAVKTLLSTFNEAYAGPDRAQKTLYVDGGIEYRPLSLPLADAQFLETRRFQIEEIARWFGVPLHLLQDLSDANYAISYEASKNFVEHTLRPIAVLAEQEANVRLFGMRAQGTTYSRINLAGLMRADPRTRGEYYRSMVNAGVMSINEVRELEELNSIGSDGDEHYLQVNMTTVERIAKGQTTQAQTAPPAAAPEREDEDEGEPTQPDNVIRRQALEWSRARREANG